MRSTIPFALALALCSFASFAARADEPGDEPVSSSEEGALGSDLAAGPSKLCGKAGTCRKWAGAKCMNKSFFAVCDTLCHKKAPDFAASQCFLKAKRKFRLDAQGNFAGGLKPSQYLSEQVARGGIAARIGCRLVSASQTAQLYFGRVPAGDDKTTLDKLRNVCLKGQAAGQERRGNAVGAERTRGKLNNGRGPRTQGAAQGGDAAGPAEGAEQ
jgi:hypothetical protein